MMHYAGFSFLLLFKVFLDITQDELFKMTFEKQFAKRCQLVMETKDLCVIANS